MADDLHRFRNATRSGEVTDDDRSLLHRRWFNAVLITLLIVSVFAVTMSPMAKPARNMLPAITESANALLDAVTPRVEAVPKTSSSREQAAEEPLTEAEMHQRIIEIAERKADAEREAAIEIGKARAAVDRAQQERDKAQARSAQTKREPPRTSSNPGNRNPVTPPPLQPPTKEALLNPHTKYFGVSTPQAPHHMSEVDAFSTLAGKAPNLLMYFQTWEDAFRPEAVEASWRKGMLPVITWEPDLPTKDRHPQLKAIVSGNWDFYIDSWADAVRETGLPVAIRFAHEMNGTWFPWSEALNGNRPGDYVKAWRHVHDRFVLAGATNAIWVWSPNLVGEKTLELSSLYPGDAYVDWVGLSGYFRYEAVREPSFEATFGKSIEEIRGLSSRPLLLTEIGAGTTEDKRVAWISSLFEALPAHDDVIGFTWFNHDKRDADKDDWRIEFSPAVAAAFAEGVANPVFGSAGHW